MLELLIYMFENYLSTQNLPDFKSITAELEAAGFDNQDIENAFTWFNQLKAMTNAIPVKNNACSSLGYRMLSENEQKKISSESLGFVLFLEQAKVLDPNEREIILDRAMALKQEQINIEEMRWIVMMALWNEGREKDFLFIEDAIYQDHNLVLH